MRTFYHSGPCGDIIYSLPTIQAFGGGRLITGLPMDLHRALAPLIGDQPCITGIGHCSQEAVPAGTINLDRFRHHPDSQKIHLVDSHLETFGFERYPWKKPWFASPEKPPYSELNIAIINRTPRYIDRVYNWNREIRWLRRHADDIYFMGLPKEYQAFRHQYDCHGMHYMQTIDLMNAAYWINKARYFSGNQSALLAIRQGLGKSYRMEQCPHTTHCNQYTGNETILNPITRKIHLLGYAIKKVITE